MTMLMTKQRLTTEEAAEYLEVNAARLHRLRKEGGGPRYFKLGRMVRYERADLDIWYEANKRSEDQ